MLCVFVSSLLYAGSPFFEVFWFYHSISSNESAQLAEFFDFPELKVQFSASYVKHLKNISGSDAEREGSLFGPSLAGVIEDRMISLVAMKTAAR